MPATIVIARGLVHPLPWCGWHFTAMGQEVKFIMESSIRSIKIFFVQIAANLCHQHIHGQCTATRLIKMR